MHKDLAKDLSEPLHILMTNGQMVESISGTAVLEDIEVDVFIAFCEFAYKGSYLPPSFREMETNPESKKRKRGDSDSPIREFEPSSLVKKACQIQKNRGGEIGFNLWDAMGAVTFQDGNDPDLEFQLAKSPAFLFHAKVYVFATRYLIHLLREHSLKCLKQNLTSCRITDSNKAQFFEMVECAYKNTGRGDIWGAHLRELVTLYVVCQIDSLLRHKEMKTLMDTYGELGSDVVYLLNKENHRKGI